MGLRFNRSISLGYGLRLNFGRRGIGISAGIPGMRFGINTTGRRTLTLGIPGTGLHFRTSRGGTRTTKRPGLRPIPCLAARTLGVGSTRHFVRGLFALTGQGPAHAREHFERARSTRHLSPSFFAAYCGSADATHHDRAIARLRDIVSARQPLPDRYLTRFVNDPLVSIRVTPSLVAALPVSKTAAALVLAEMLQARDRDAAISVLEQARRSDDGDTTLVASLAELYCVAERWDDVVSLTDETSNEDDISCQTLILRARALAELGWHAPALGALKEALRSRKRPLSLLLAARYERASVYASMGDDKNVQKELAAIHALHASYEDVPERIGAPKRSGRRNDLVRS